MVVEASHTGKPAERKAVPRMPETAQAKPNSAVWWNLLVDIGSELYITATRLQVEQKGKTASSVPDCDQLWKVRKACASRGEKPKSLLQWPEGILQDICPIIKTKETDMQTDKMDSRLAHLVEAKQSLLERWKSQRLHRKLRKKIAELNRQIDEHCQDLSS
ncbi:hypothetical protein MTO96_041344 [Rhipicephalus appendiculatus]